ncbi:sensor histidine kinase [Phormidium sp. CCY1219]|uniref:sensor histidine kinase n=1 Tax=Phormidium sp. CCY1219 TaxID=2886104 RepID=UPI002D7756F8|nr:HAMP domain-containing sensor histidine kinase [Phormidium sp. CCY1219]
MLSWLGKQSAPLWRKIDLHSLQVRLTAGIAAVSALGIGSLAIATSWQMQQQLVFTHKQNVKYIFQRFAGDVEYYSARQAATTGLQPAIERLSADKVLLWVKGPDGAIVAQSKALSGRTDTLDAALKRLPASVTIPQAQFLKGRYWLWCSGSLTVKGTHLGELYVAQDITQDYQMLVGIIRSLSLASVAAIAAMTFAIALYVRRSLQPLCQLSQMTNDISAEDLGKVRMQLDNAPTEVKQLARTCNMMLDRLSQSWEHQRQFVSNVSHELRTPLTIVSGYIQSLKRRGNNLTEPQREALGIAAAEADRTIQLLQDLLDMARADSGYLHFHLEPISIPDLVAEVASMARQYSNRQIALDCHALPFPALGDRNRLKQVLLNLIDNAVKYSPDHTPISVRVRPQHQAIAIDIGDKGPGIPLAQLPRIFERFYRIDEARSRSTGGTGLGLSIVKTLVEGMGGTVTVHSKLGDGSVFTVILPTSS